MSDRSSTTLGYERSTNPYLDSSLSRTAFVEKILEEVPPFPPYYRRMKEVNARGACELRGLPGDVELSLADFQTLRDSGAVVIDLRDELAFGGGHIPLSFGIGIRGNISQWASWVVPYETPILLVTSNAADRRAAIRALVRVGLDDVRGSLAGGILAWRESGAPLTGLRQRSVCETNERLEAGELTLLDVRPRSECLDGRVGKADWAYLGDLESLARERRDEWTRGQPSREVALVCRTGYRSTVGASVLARQGFENVTNVVGGMRAWRNAGLPLQH